MYFAFDSLYLQYPHEHPFFTEIVILQHFHTEYFALMVKSVAILAYKYQLFDHYSELFHLNMNGSPFFLINTNK